MKRSIALASFLLALACEPQVLPEADPNGFGSGCFTTLVAIDLQVVGAVSCSALEAAMPAAGQESWTGCFPDPTFGEEWCTCGSFSGPAANCFDICENVGVEELGVDEGCFCRCGSVT
jgi:hypothetical protein